jgi:ferredoxin
VSLIKIKWTSRLGKAHAIDAKAGTESAILELCENAGLELPHGCRVGVCGSCRVQVVEGEELLSERSFLESDTLERHRDGAEIRLACRATLRDVSATAKTTKSLVLVQAPEAIFEDE